MERKWWQEKVAYQIYPKSFCDSNGDGVGDIPGIISRLDYLKNLGIDIIWLSPVYKSPLADEGYDISDYYDIHPLFGSMADLDRLIAETKKRQMYLVMDLVVNHCSDEHEWFQKACEDPDGEYGNYFYIRDAKDGRPCNWRSYFGGSVWSPLPGREDKLYFHAFHKKQPDLNWENPKVRQEIYKNINWWLEKGIAGFRIDAIINIKKVLPFKDYPADREDGLCSILTMLEEAQGVGEFLGEMRDQAFQPHDAFTVGEVFNEKEGELPDFIGDNGYFSSMFDFNEAILNASPNGWYDSKPVTPEQYKNACFLAQQKSEKVGFLSNIIENHDEPRGVNRYIPEGEVTDTAKKMLATVNFMLRGLPFIYQGQEIGMENTVFHSIEEVDDISTIEEYKTALQAGLSVKEALETVNKFSRDNARTPMQWDNTAHGGFTEGKPWLKENDNYKELNVAAEEKDETSVLNYYKELIKLRKDPAYKETIIYGELVPYKKEQENLMAYFRNSENQAILVAANYQKNPQEMKLPEKKYNVLLNNCADLKEKNGVLELDGYQAVVLELI